MNQSCEHLILGAGPTGLGAAYRLNELGHSNFIVLEAQDEVGGLSRSYIDKAGFTWDIGGHVQFSHYPYFDQVMERAVPLSERQLHDREAWVYFQGEFIPYPFQNNIHLLAPTLAEDCWEGLKKLDPMNTPPNNFKDWILSQFGQPLSDLFMLPYNYKVWAHPPELMSYSWIGERVSVVDLERIKKNFASKRPDQNWGPNNQFWFPNRGGTGSIWKNVARLCGANNFQFNSTIQHIELKRKCAFLNDGRIINYKNLLSTIPLPSLTSLLYPTQKEWQHDAAKLLFSSGHIIGLGMKGPLPEQLKKKCWIYFSGPETPCYRITIFSNYSPYNVPNPGQEYSLLCEVSESKYKTVASERLMDEVIAGLIKMKFLSPDTEILSKWYFKAHYSYPIPSIERDHLLKSVLLPLESQGIFSRGRFGGWKYEVANQDHSFMQGVEWVNKIVCNNKENVFQV